METLLPIAEKISTPLSLAALAVLALVYIVRYLFERLDMASIMGVHLYRIVMRALTYVFVLAVIGLLLGALGYGWSLYATSTKVAFTRELIQKIGAPSASEALAALSGLLELDCGQDQALALAACTAAAHRVPRVTTTQGPLNAVDDIGLGALRTISHCNRQGACNGLDLTERNLAGAEIPDAHFAGIRFSGSDLRFATLLDADFREANLYGVNFTQTVLRDADLPEAKLAEAIWRQTDLRGADLTDATGLAGADLQSSLVEGIVLTRVNLTDTKFPP